MTEAVSKGIKVVAGLVVGGAAITAGMTQWEGNVHHVYADKLAGGLPTVCAGHTDWNMRVGTPYTKQECERINSMNAEKYGLGVIACVGHTDEHRVLNQHQFDALTLFAINVGVKGACGSRAVRLIKQGKHEQGCDAIAHSPNGTPVWSYVNGGTKFVRGLYNRRLFERDWCLRPMPQEQHERPTMFASILTMFR